MKTQNCCRCCLSQACFKDISNEYYHDGKKEVYSDLLFDTFNIKISYCDTSQRLTCEDCIVQLRSAAAFRRQVLRTEEVFTNRIKDVHIDTLPLKVEDDFIDHITADFEDTSDHSDCSSDDDDVGWQNDDTLDEPDEEKGDLFVIKLEPTEHSQNTKNLSRNTRVRKSTRSTKRNMSNSSDNVFDDIELIFQSEEDKVQKSGDRKTAKSIKGKPVKKEPPKRKLKNPTPQTQIDMKDNSLKLINNSNICLFDSLKTKFRCFYCTESFLKITELREHTKTHSNPKYLKMCINRLRGMSFKNVDISSLTCKLCMESVKELTDLRNHLNNSHKIEFSGTEHMLIPYRLENGFQCTLCNQEFNTFFRLSIHMNSHYTNNVCEICGVSYINRLSLRTHVHSMHREKTCSICPATFQNNYSRVKHMRKVHGSSSSKRYCLLCNKTFPYTYLLIEHRIQEHGVKRQISSCIECGKTFLTPQNLRIHIRSVHIRERNHPCTYCGMRFFTKCDQRRHERTHLDVRSFSCSYCEGRFKSKDSLRRHLKRQHGHLFVSSHGEMQ